MTSPTRSETHCWTCERNACACVTAEAAVEMLARGFDGAEVHAACFEFWLPSGVLTYWKGSDMGGDNWVFEESA